MFFLICIYVWILEGCVNRWRGGIKFKFFFLYMGE